MARLLPLVMLLSLCFPGAPDAADRAWIDVTVRVYDAELVPDADKARALAIAAAVLATIHVERVEWLAREGQADPVVLLGRAIAHELVHVLSGQGTHTPRGLMRAVWSLREVRHDHADDWRLHEAETTLLRNRRRQADLQALCGRRPTATAEASPSRGGC